MKILVTGGTGFLGRNLIKHFLHSRNFVALVTRDPKKVKKLNFCDHENLNVIDSSSLFSLKEGFKFFNPDIIIHTACCYGRKNEDDNSMFESNYKFQEEDLLKRFWILDSGIFYFYSLIIPAFFLD